MDQEETTDDQKKKKTHQGPTWLLQILLSESVYLIWILRCERVVQEKPLTNGEIKARWHCAINESLTINKVTAMKVTRTDKFMKLVEETWEPVLRKEGEIQQTGGTVVRF